MRRRMRGRWLRWARFAGILRQGPLLRTRITHSWAVAGGTLEEPAAVILHGGMWEGEFQLSPGGLTRARNGKRRIRPKKTYRSPGLILGGLAVH